MLTRSLLSLLLLLTLLTASDFNNNFKILNQNIKSEFFLSKETHSNWFNPNRTIDSSTLLVLDDEDLFGSWVAVDMLIYEDNSFTNGYSVIDSADFEVLVFTFYEDYTLDLWFEYVDYEEIEYYNWYTENDSIYR